jgi:hypothetical protein
MKNVPAKKERVFNEERPELNRDVFQRGYDAREQFAGSEEQRVFFI